MERFIYALGIRDVGEATARTLARHYKTIESIEKATTDELEMLNDIGPVVAANIHTFFKQEHNLDIIQRLLLAGIKWESKAAETSQVFAGLSFVLTGSLQKMTRVEATEKTDCIRVPKVTGSVSSKTNYVVFGEDPGSKYEKAMKLGIETLDEESFMEKINLSNTL